MVILRLNFVVKWFSPDLNTLNCNINACDVNFKTTEADMLIRDTDENFVIGFSAPL